MTFDNTERRLITGARDGVLNIWNYNNGHCLRKLQKSKGNDEICDVLYVEMNKNRYIISVGWDKRININSDCQIDSNIHQVQHPNIVWTIDLKNGHKEDVLSIAQCQPNLLTTAGYDGEIVVWNMTSTKGALISTMTINEANIMLCVADNLGFVFVYNIDGYSYALSGYEEEPPELVNTWRGHVDGISCIELVEKNKVIMTASIDCTVRLWNYEGNYIGTFGQQEQWDLYNTSTFCHPMVPYDVLIDPMSLPSQPVLKEGSKTDDLLEEIKKKEEETQYYLYEYKDFHRGQNDENQSQGFEQVQKRIYSYLIKMFLSSTNMFTGREGGGALPIYKVIGRATGIGYFFQLENMRIDEENYQKYMIRSIKVQLLAKIQPAYTSYAKPQINIDDETIARDIKDLNAILKDTGLDEEQANNYHGKWLRHDKTKINKIDKGGPSDYQTLKWSQIVDPPNPDFPKVKFDKDDPFGSGMDSEMMTNSLKSFTNKQQAVS
ncbi:uncharacterized protein LOC134697955 [Mytilus trossulus]|uniref:uncharacterized protein LOC134697955 n=1 Tax=Mytilus trossulus TaxID=6551 RepID=UPI003004ED5B